MFRTIGAGRLREIHNSLVAAAAGMLQRQWGTARCLPSAGQPVAGMVAVELPSGLLQGLDHMSTENGPQGLGGAPSFPGTNRPIVGMGGLRARGDEGLFEGIRDMAPASSRCGAADCTVPSCSGTCADAARVVHERLRVRFHIEVPVTSWEGRLWVRISSQLYNTWEDYIALSNAVLVLWAE